MSENLPPEPPGPDPAGPQPRGRRNQSLVLAIAVLALLVAVLCCAGSLFLAGRSDPAREAAWMPTTASRVFFDG